jgi:RNA polymerase sigma-70 factor (ECF subfamily)
MIKFHHSNLMISSQSASQNPQDTKASFEAAVEKYHARIFQLVYRYLGNYDEADDVTQETFIRAYRAWDNFRGDAQVYTWLYRIALNLCHNQKKKMNRRQQTEGPSLDAPLDYSDENESQTTDVPDNSAVPWHTLERKELNQQLFDAVQGLPENYRIVIVLRDIEGLSYEEIAQVTSSSLEAIKSRLFRARNLLRARLSNYVVLGNDETGKNAN